MSRTCTHERAKFYAVQQLGGMRSIRLYNCPDCKSTISEQTVRDAQRAAALVLR